ncbi:lysM and putative peptidoglycan-binding domain-containing protein 1 isoform X2 [Rhincodon typus]|uniref:lysM and putative peptidoglycan-binding domain-containing protein 1 isoform X2 n=1 Tax=Rhincodon typus TaxID=259920 RepID=UPI00202E9BA7|nr:lysM and putative peptidoglycan-binding domain-containing protein 1 isoform X2 [Rhincodon typus]
MEAAEGGGAAAECGSLRASARGTSRSYGSTDRGPAAGQRHLEHRPMPGDTLQGLALRYGVSECLRIPIPKQGPLQNGSTVPDGAPGQSEPALDPLSPELSPMEFLKRLDSKITQSKAGAIRKLSDGAGRLDGAVDGGAGSLVARDCHSERPPASRHTSAQRARLGPMCLTRTTRVTTLREMEDQIFDL